MALNARSGEKIWHFQAVHHGVWDYDFPCAPNLVDIRRGDELVPAVAQVSKQGFTYVFDRRDGTYIADLVRSAREGFERSAPDMAEDDAWGEFDRLWARRDSAAAVVPVTPTTENPYRGQPLHAWVSLFEVNSSTIPLATAWAAMLMLLLLAASDGGAVVAGAAFTAKGGLPASFSSLCIDAR